MLLGLLNILRMAVYLVSSNVYDVRRSWRAGKSRAKRAYLPTVTLLIPAHNEAAVIEKTLESVWASNYPKLKLTIVVVDDGSTDVTKKIVRRFIRCHPDGFAIRLVTQPNSGKAIALNNAINKHVSSRLVMCLDADSLLDRHAIRNAAQYFHDRKVVALASNVNIIEDKTILGLVQRFEYLISYQMKKAHTVLNTEYIIGGVGSMFRANMLERVQYYDSNTMTEDIDLTMKIISTGNRRNRVVYGSDCLAYTEAVPSFKSLVRQRYRWKYGRMQTFLKNRHLFFNADKRYAKQLTFFTLPLAILQEFNLLLEPLLVGLILYLSIRDQDPRSLLFALVIVTVYVSLNIWTSEHLSIRQRLRLSLFAAPMYFLLYVLAIVEYAALVKSVGGLSRLKHSIAAGHVTWKSPERSAAASLQEVSQ